ncbi:MAG: hypothetical protein QXL22_04410 [Candidatus Nezhaarchaeales archaeon]
MMARSSPLIAALNKYIDRSFHKYFDDPDRCIEAVFLDAAMHQYVEALLGLSREEIMRRTARYFGKAMERCMASIFREAFK